MSIHHASRNTRLLCAPGLVGAAVAFLAMPHGAVAQANPTFVASVGATLYRVAPSGEVEAFPGQIGRTTGLTLVPKGAKVSGARPGDVIGVEPNAGGRFWRVEGVHSNGPLSLVEIGRQPAGVGTTDIAFAHGRLFGISNAGVFYEFNTDTFQLVGTGVPLTSGAVTTGGLAFNGDANWYLCNGNANRIIRLSDPPTAASWTALPAAGVDFDSSDLDMLGETLWGAIRSPGNTSGSLLIGSFNEETGAFTMLWNVVRVPTNVNVNVGLAALRRVCPADFNEDGTVSSQDFFDFLPAFFAEMPEGDFDRDGRINSQDFFDFLAAFFAGC